MTYQEEYLSILSIHAKPRSLSTYRFWIEAFLNYVEKPEEEIVMDDISRFANLIKLKYKSKSIELALFIVRSFVRFLHERGVCVADVSRMRIPKGYSARKDPITPEEYVAILSVIPAKTPLGIRDNMIIRLLYDTGARIGELSQLNDAINPGDLSITIHTEKTADARILSWSKDTAVFMSAWMKKKESRPLIPCTRQIDRIVKKYSEAARIKKHVHPHLFRHGKAHLILDNGGTVRDVQDILGHRSPISSFMYLRWNEEKRLERHRRFLTPPKIDKTEQGEYHSVYAKTINLQRKDSHGSQETGLENAQDRYDRARDRKSHWQKPNVGVERYQGARVKV